MNYEEDFQEYDAKPKTGLGVWIVAGLAAFVGIGWIVGEIKELNQSPEQAAAEAFSSSVRGTALEMVKSRLKYPEEAEFDLPSMGWQKREGGTVDVWGAVVSKNGFGVKTRNDWRLIMKPAGKKWILVWLKIGDQVEGVLPATGSLGGA